MHEELVNHNQSFADGGIGKTLLHVTVGGVSSLAKGGDFLTGAAAAGVRELLSPLSANTNQKSQDAIAQLVGGSIGALTQGSKGVNIGSSIALSAEQNNRQLHQKEIEWIKKHSIEFAKELYGANPTKEQIADAQARLAQQALRGVDKGWSLKLGSKADKKAKAFLERNNANLFTVKDEYEFKDGSTDGLREISSYSNKEFEELNNFYQQNIHRATTTNKDGSLRFANQEWANEKGLIDALKEGKITKEQFNQAIRDFVPNTIDSIKNIPNTIKSATNYIDAIAPTTNKDRLDTLYGSQTDGSLLQANLATTDAISTATMATGVGTLTKAGVKAVDKSLTKSINEAIDIRLDSIGTIKGVIELPDGKVKLELDGSKSVEVPKDIAYDNKGIYDPKAVKQYLEEKFGAENVESPTIPTNPKQASSTRKDVIIDENGNKAVQIKLEDGTVKNIPYDDRGYPIFDDVAKYTTTIKKPKNWENMSDKARRNAEMRAATRQLREDIESGKVDASQFTEKQLKYIKKGSDKIPDYTWHHNAQSSPNNMQLVPEKIHNEQVPHTGEGSMSNGKK